MSDSSACRVLFERVSIEIHVKTLGDVTEATFSYRRNDLNALAIFATESHGYVRRAVYQ